MKVLCPIASCRWKHEIQLKGNETENEIYSKAKALMAHHRRTSRACMQHICSCSASFTSQTGLDRHIQSKPTIVGGEDNHFELSYAAIISQDNHTILNVETLNEEQVVRNFAAFRDANGVVYGSNIGRNSSTINPPLFALTEFTRTGSKVITQPVTRPKKKPKQFGSTSFSDMNDDGSCDSNETSGMFDSNELPSPLEESPEISSPFESTEDPLPSNSSNAVRRSARSSVLADRNIRLMSSCQKEPRLRSSICLDTNASDRMSGTSSILPSLLVDVSEENTDHDHACRRSTRLLQQTNHSDSNSNDQSLVPPEDDSLNVPITIDPLVNRFFQIHEDRDSTDNPELNTNGVNGIIDEEQMEEIEIGWGEADQGADEDPDAFLNVPAFAGPDEALNEALQNLSLNDEIYGNSSALPEYNNAALPVRTPEQMASVNPNISRYVKSIKRHRETVSLTPIEHMKYLEILVEMNRSNAPQSLFNSVSKLIFHNFGGSMSDFDTAPTRETLFAWIAKKVHPPDLIHLSKAQKTVLVCPSGRSVAITHFDYEYQLALLLSNEEVMNPDNLLFPNFDDPFELPPADGPLEDVNSGFFHQKMTRAHCKYKNDLLFTFVDFCDGTNVSRNSIGM